MFFDESTLVLLTVGLTIFLVLLRKLGDVVILHTRKLLMRHKGFGEFGPNHSIFLDVALSPLLLAVASPVVILVIVTVSVLSFVSVVVTTIS